MASVTFVDRTTRTSGRRRSTASRQRVVFQAGLIGHLATGRFESVLAGLLEFICYEYVHTGHHHDHIAAHRMSGYCIVRLVSAFR